MLIDLLDKKARLENSYAAIKSKVYNVSHGTGSPEAEINVALDVLNKIRSFNLLIKEEKAKIRVSVGEQKFDLNDWDVITEDLRNKISLYDMVLNNMGHGVDAVSTINQRDTLQADLDQINKAIDSAIWRQELDG